MTILPALLIICCYNKVWATEVEPPLGRRSLSAGTLSPPLGASEFLAEDGAERGEKPDTRGGPAARGAHVATPSVDDVTR
jgi:hypothetical protein